MQKKHIAGKYELVRRIASGGMAEVFLARHVGLVGFQKLVVLKRILPHLAEQPEYVQMFLDEARTAADLRHSNVVNTFEVGEDDGIHFTVMEFLHGQDVRTLFRRLQSLQQSLPLHHAVGIIVDASSGLHHAHTKTDLHGKRLEIVHRDISPQNIFVTYDGEIKVVDFGVAKAAHQSKETSSGVLKGKYSYMSPEQALGHDTDHRTDQFALAIVLYELTTMQRLFKKQNDVESLRAIVESSIPRPSNILSAYPRELEGIVMKALHRNRHHRFRDCHELRVALEEFLMRQGAMHSPHRLGAYLRTLFTDEHAKDLLVQSGSDVEHVPLWLKAKAQSEEYSKEQNLEESFTFSYAHQWVRARVMPLVGGFAVICGIAIFSGFWSKHRQFADSASQASLAPIQVAEIIEAEPVAEPSSALESQEKFKEGRLKIVVHPWANVFVDGVHVGSTPMPAQSLKPGQYRIRLENPGLRKKIEKQIEIRADEDTLVRHKW